MTPVELLKQELRVYEKALKLSKEKFTEGKIDLILHKKHINNLEPKILEYKLAIEILNRKS
jgi:hypothetical protein